MDFPFFERLSTIRGFIFSFEGVFTNNKLLVLNNGELLRQVNQIDGRALALAVQKRYRVAVIVDQETAGVNSWLKSNGVRDIFKQGDLRQASYETFVIENGLDLKETIFIGSDVNDYSAMQLAGIAACPADAVPEIKAIAHYISEAKGGEGCAREVISLVLKAHNQWEWS
jgi:3-deoxy-D-manno-octulosonate 8-phosphate phosphatase (KDO 8-P phosphatase)